MGGKFDRMRRFAERIIEFMRVRLDVREALCSAPEIPNGPASLMG